jgi:hypothetical protein
MMCLCPDGSYANGYPAVCPTARVPRQYYAPRSYPPALPNAHDIETKRRAAEAAEAERLARQKALDEEAKRKHDADIARAVRERQTKVREREEELKRARQSDQVMQLGDKRPNHIAPVNGSKSLVRVLKNQPSSAGRTPNAWSAPTPPSAHQIEASNKRFESVLNDPKQPMASRRLAAAVLGKPLSNLSANNEIGTQSAPQVSQAQRELAAIAYGKQPLPTRLSPSLSLDEQLRATMNNAKESPEIRAISAIALGIDPKTLNLNMATGKPAATPVDLGTAVSVGTPTTIAKPTAPIGTAPALRLNPNLSTDIAKLTPPSAAVTPKPAAPVQNQYAAPASTFAPAVASGQNIAVLDSKMAKQTLPYALLSRDVYDDKGGNVGTATEWKRTDNWDTLLLKNGASTATINSIRNSGFYAAVYQNQKTGQISIAFRGTDSIIELNVSGRANAGFLPMQYEAASTLTAIVKRNAGPDQSITLTGHSLGGALASYAANDNKIKNVVTFNAARGFQSDGFVNNPNQINIYTRGEIIGDPAKAGIAGTGRLPGLSVGTDSMVSNNNLSDDLAGAHSIANIVGTLSDKALEK